MIIRDHEGIPNLSFFEYVPTIRPRLRAGWHGIVDHQSRLDVASPWRLGKPQASVSLVQVATSESGRTKVRQCRRQQSERNNAGRAQPAVMAGDVAVARGTRYTAGGTAGGGTNSTMRNLQPIFSYLNDDWSSVSQR